MKQQGVVILKKWTLFVISSILITIALSTLLLIALFKYANENTIYLMAQNINFMGPDGVFDSLFILILVLSIVVSVLVSKFVFWSKCGE